MSKGASKGSGTKPKKKKKDSKAADAPRMIALPPPGPAVPDLSIMADPADTDPARRHLAQARARWEHGDWDSLLALDPAAIAEDADRARLALILAAAHSHAGDMARAGALARQAIAWGASRNMAARVLLSAAQNSLARVAAALEEDPAPHFEAAIRLVQPHADAPLLARSRRVRELARMGLLPDAAAVLEAELGLIRAEAVGSDTHIVTQLEGQLGLLRKVIAESLPAIGQNRGAAPRPPKFCQRALDTYTALDPARQARFVYLDVKSLPRTGLHFMRNTFESLLGELFSFCEWYTEPGCCGQMPCAVTGYATEVPGVPLLRMLKSHDFDLTDPVFPPAGPIQRLILLRDPLYLLTSWLALQVLYWNGDLLGSHGVPKTKINFAHSPHVVRSAYRIIDAEGTMPRPAALASWLNDRTPYILGFVTKWAEAARDHPQRCRVVRYDDTPEAVLQVLEPMEKVLPDDVRVRIDTFRRDRGRSFKARQNPFHSQSRRIADFLQEHADTFRAAAETIRRQDRSGLLAAGRHGDM